jgi:hypothetical protein
MAAADHQVSERHLESSPLTNLSTPPSENQKYICKGDVAESYDSFKAQGVDKLDGAVDELLARDGPPSFGDCV